MGTTIKKVILLVPLLLIFAADSLADQPVYPVKVSPNGRYFIDQNEQPVFWLGITQWQIFRGYTLDEARLILENAKSKGFAVVQAMLMGVGDGTQPNLHGQKPWIDNNSLTPNEEYFKNVDSVIQIARENNLIISLTIYHQRVPQLYTVKKSP